MKQRSIKKFKLKVAKKFHEDLCQEIENHLLQWRTLDYSKADIIQELFQYVESVKGKEFNHD
jgi:hypothetical protein